jgi:hypothetical protein
MRHGIRQSRVIRTCSVCIATLGICPTVGRPSQAEYILSIDFENRVFRPPNIDFAAAVVTSIAINLSLHAVADCGRRVVQ